MPHVDRRKLGDGSAGVGGIAGQLGRLEAALEGCNSIGMLLPYLRRNNIKKKVNKVSSNTIIKERNDGR